MPHRKGTNWMCRIRHLQRFLSKRQYQPDAFVHDYLGLGLKPAVRVNTGGATGGSALRIGYAEVASGLYDICLVLGVEKCNDCFNYEMGITTPEVLRAILYTADMTYDNPAAERQPRVLPSRWSRTGKNMEIRRKNRWPKSRSRTTSTPRKPDRSISPDPHGR